jgi:anti-sigma factor RsiW
VNITRDIIMDLMPVYLAGECSGDTRALVDAWLAANPKEAEWLRRADKVALPPTPAPASFRNAAISVDLKDAG